jgi:hypothetical protein
MNTQKDAPAHLFQSNGEQCRLEDIAIQAADRPTYVGLGTPEPAACRQPTGGARTPKDKATWIGGGI